MVDALDLGSSGAIRGGSSPPFRMTLFLEQKKGTALCASAAALASRWPSEASEEVAPTLRARHPRLLIRSAKSRFGQTNRATCPRLGAGIGLIDLRQSLLFLELGGSRLARIRCAEHFLHQIFFHCFVGGWFFRQVPSSIGQTIHRAPRHFLFSSPRPVLLVRSYPFAYFWRTLRERWC